MIASAKENTSEAALAVLRRLLAGPEWVRLYGSNRAPGLFPSRTAASLRLTDFLRAKSCLELDDESASNPRCRLTASGREWLLQNDNPRLLLEDLIRVGENLREDLRSIQSACEIQLRRLERQSADITLVLERLTKQTNVDPIAVRVVAVLEAHQQTGNAVDCSLGQLFRELREETPLLSIGQFHDTVRSLHSVGRIRLSPWTGPLYQLPEPELSLLIGHEVLYYVHLRDAVAA